MLPDGSDNFLKENQWNLAKAYLDRSDQSATVIRGLLFSAATAAIGFITYQKTGGALIKHWLPLLLFGSGAAMVFISWDIQKSKAIKRFQRLKNGDYSEPDNISNQHLDRISACLVAAGAIAEIIIRMFDA